MDGNDCNWEPSEFNAKNLNADGEIYLECGAYILIYPYINEWSDQEFRVVVYLKMQKRIREFRSTLQKHDIFLI